MTTNEQIRQNVAKAAPSQERRKRSSLRSTLGLAGALIVGAALAMMLSSSGSLLESGAPAPAFVLSTVEASAEEVSLESLLGKVVIIDFWQTTCPPCLRQMRDLEIVNQQMSDDDLVILGINTEGASSPEVREFTRERGVRYPILIDNHGVAERYRVDRLPTLYVVDKEGFLRWSRVGFTPHAELVEIIRELI